MYIKERKKDSTRHFTLTVSAACLALLRAHKENVNKLANELLADYCRQLQHGSIMQAHAESRRSRWRETAASVKINLRLRSDLLDYLLLNQFSVGGVVRSLIADYCQKTYGDGAGAEAAERSEA